MRSARLANKPLADIGGLPLIARTLQRARLAQAALEARGHTCRIAVATDHEEIRQACEAQGARVIMTASDHASGSDRVVEALDGLNDADGIDPGVVVNIQGDEPFLDPQAVVDAVELLHGRPDFHFTTCANRLDGREAEAAYFDPNAVKVVCADDQRALYFSRAPIPFVRDAPGQAPKMVLRHVGLYAWRADNLRRFVAHGPHPIEEIEKLEQLRALALGMWAGVSEGSYFHLDVNTPEDLERARRLWSQGALEES
jgi:3-deoxy-manno-octulosonate cytidylyltransferase (CMP-KDO synthetase)